MRFLTIFVAFFLSPNASLAENLVPFPSHLLPVGTVLTYEYDNGQKSTRRVLSNDGNGFEILQRGSRDYALFERIIVASPRGMVTKLEEKEQDWVYQPHNCIRVIGECGYTVSKIDGDTYSRNYQSTFKNGLLIAEVLDEEGKTVFLYKILYDDEGMILNWTEQRRGKTPTVMKLVNVTPPND
ncbi:MAG: hypothetical protein AAF231_07210 [Pseudomonadota bacterium]